MKAIAACDRNWAIGNNNKLLCHLPGDLKYFKENTLGKTVIMGRKTLESLPGGKPLPDRETVILSTTLESCESYKVFGSIEEVLEYCKDKDAMVCGGETVYRQFLPYCDEILLTVIDEEFEADAYFPDLDKEGMTVKWQSEVIEEKGHKYTFRRYGR